MAMIHYAEGDTLFFLPLVLASLFFGLKVLQAIARVWRKPTSRLPGPWYSNWTAAKLKYEQLAGSACDYVNALHAQYGLVVRIAPNYIVFSDLPSVKRIHTVKHDFIKDEWYAPLAGGGISVFNGLDPIYHRERRRVLSAPMAESALKVLLPKIDAKVRQTIVRMREEMSSRGAADISKWWLFMTTDVIGELTFGESFRMLDQGKKTQYIRDLEVGGKADALLTTFPWLARLPGLGLPVPIIQAATANRTRVFQYSAQSIRRYKKQLLETNSPPQTFFTKFLDKADAECLSDREICTEAMTYIIAGSDTTSNSLTYLVWAVCRNKDVQHALVQELQQLPDDFTATDLRDLRHLNNVIDETLRLYPAAPALLPRVVPPGGETLAGYWLAGGTTVATQAWTLHRLPEVFPKPLKWDPSRWDHPSQEMKDAFMPFGGGARVCLGRHLARIELRLGATRFFRAFPNARISAREGMSDKDMDPLQYFVLKPAGSRCLVELG